MHCTVVSYCQKNSNTNSSREKDIALGVRNQKPQCFLAGVRRMDRSKNLNGPVNGLKPQLCQVRTSLVYDAKNDLKWMPNLKFFQDLRVVEQGEKLESKIFVLRAVISKPRFLNVKRKSWCHAKTRLRSPAPFEEDTCIVKVSKTAKSFQRGKIFHVLPVFGKM